MVKLIGFVGVLLLISSCGSTVTRNFNTDDKGNNNSESSDFEKYFHLTSELDEGMLFTRIDASEYPVGNQECIPDNDDGNSEYYIKLTRQQGQLSGQLMSAGGSACFILMHFNTEQLFELVYDEGSEIYGYSYNEAEETFTILFDPKVPPVFCDLEVTTGAEYISLEKPCFFVGRPSTVFVYIGLEDTISIDGSSVSGYFESIDMSLDEIQRYTFSSLSPETAYRIIVVAENNEGYTISETVQTTATCTLLSAAALPDAGLSSAIRTAISKPTGNICREDLAAIKTFSASDSNISDLTGLEYFTSLSDLDLSHNQIVNISGLSGLTGLRDLRLMENQIVDISSLSGLTGLRGLDLRSNQIVDVSVLSGLTGIRDIYLSSNQIADISSLSELTGLGGLDLSSNQIVDISSLAGLTSLSYLELSNNQIVSITPLMTNFGAGGLVGASVSLSTNNLDAQALSDAQTLLDNGVNISW